MTTARDQIMYAAWAAFLQWALANDDVRALFQSETGRRLPHPDDSPIDRMIDEATGYANNCLVTFVDWATDEMWGIDDTPDAYRLDRKARAARHIP